MTLWTPGQRKILVGVASAAAVTAYAVWRVAPFAEYAAEVRWLVGLYFAAHVSQKATAKVPTP